MNDIASLNERKGFLEKLSRDIHLESLKQSDFYSTDCINNILVDSHQAKTKNQNHLRYYTFRESDTQFIVGFKRSSYEHGEEVPYDEGENYINKINYLAVSSNVDSHLVRKLLASALLDSKRPLIKILFGM
ncbi:hypothetical protein ACFL1R_05280 [Candidatus Latescibacterota bacterium]